MPKRTAKAAKQPEFAIEMEDFGPITRGKITLKPLTVFIGPNNSGKSYAAMLIDAVMKCRTGSRHIRPGALYLPRRRGWTEVMSLPTPPSEKLERFIREIPAGQKQELPPELRNETLRTSLEDLYVDSLTGHVERSFRCGLSELTRIRSEKLFRLCVNGIRIELAAMPQGDRPVSLSIKEIPNLRTHIVVERLHLGPVMFRSDGANFDSIDHLPYALINEIVRMVVCYYVPAARAGILVTFKLLIKNTFDSATSGGIEDPGIPGVVSRFVSQLISLPQEKGPLYDLGKEFENELIRGEIVLQGAGEFPYPELKYRFQETDIALGRSSSSVSELTPLFLYVKYVVTPGSILIIEEPETHLHPESQRILAKYLVRLVRAGVIVLITTHSEYLVEQFSNFIMLGKVDAKRRAKRYDYEAGDVLRADEIGAYVFQRDPESGGHVIHQLEITEEEGIPQEEFVRIHEALYEETYKLRRDLEPKA